MRAVWRALALLAAFAAVSLPARAHRLATGGQAPVDAIVIASLTHGQMSVIADNRAAILDLAARQFPTDPVMRRLEGFIHLQYFDCLWGWVPGSIADENSPFNECSHAYLAGTRALLLHLQTMPGDRTAVRALIGKIELEMIAQGASLNLCRHSDEQFNTAERIAPRWADVPFHPPSLIAFASLGLALAGAGMALRWSARSAGSGTIVQGR